jgi:hypothetical protein
MTRNEERRIVAAQGIQATSCRYVSYVLLALAFLFAPTLPAQVVRGDVREAVTGTSVPGVLVTLERMSTNGSIAADFVSELSDARGEFAIRAPMPGRYRLAAKRIGVKRTVTQPFELAAGETKQLSIELEAMLYMLPEISIATANFCIPRKEQVGPIAALWEEARTALSATSISVRDSLYRGRIVSFARLLDGRGRVLNETSKQYDGLLNQTFSGIHPETLSVRGYWRDEEDSVRFDAPDVDVLLSEPFLREHCFELVNETQGEEVGVRFEPVPGRPVADVRGTMWLDARTFELRRLEFTYTRLPRVERAEHLGGEVHFARLASGAWVVRRWSIRVPQFANISASRREMIRRYDRADPTVMRAAGATRLVENRMIENGGVAYIDHLRTFEKPATIRGVVRDSAGAPLSPALIRLAGTHYSAPVDSNGSFKLDSVPPGMYRIEAVTDSVAALGIADAQQEVTVLPDLETFMTLKADGLDGLLTRMCGGRQVPKDRTALRVVLIDETAGRPDNGTALRLWWTEYVRERGVSRVVQQQLDASTAVDGSVVFCGLPIDVPLDLGLAFGPDRAQRLAALRLPSRTPLVRTIRH